MCMVHLCLNKGYMLSNYLCLGTEQIVFDGQMKVGLLSQVKELLVLGSAANMTDCNPEHSAHFEEQYPDI